MSGSSSNSANLSSAEPRPLIGIVDDDPIMGKSLVQRLQLEGYQQSGGNRAKKLCSTYPARTAGFWSATSACRIWMASNCSGVLFPIWERHR